MNTVTCDLCFAEFAPEIVVNKQDDGGETWWFVCPQCAHGYPVSRITAKGVMLRELLQRKRRVKDKTPKAQRQIARLEKDLAAEVTQL